MGFLDLRWASLSLLLLLLTAAPVYLTQDHAPDVTQQSQEAASPITEEELKQAIREVLAEHHTIPFPGLPPLVIDNDLVSVTFSLADFYLTGLNYSIVNLKPGILFNPASVTVEFKKLSLFAGSYSSSGHLINLPLNGEGPMYVHMHDLSITFSFDWKVSLLCAEYNTTAYDFDLQRMETRFENLNVNEGADMGQVVNIVLPSFGQDIVEYLEILISNKYYLFFDNLFISLINWVTKCPDTTLDDTILETDELRAVIGDIIKDFLP